LNEEKKSSKLEIAYISFKMMMALILYCRLYATFTKICFW